MNKGTSYTAIVFADDKAIPPRKYVKWINDYSLSKKQFQRFIKNNWPVATYANLYNKETGKFYQRISI